jgi:hypothetical protein
MPASRNATTMVNRIPKVCTDLHRGIRSAESGPSSSIPRRPDILSRTVAGVATFHTADRELSSSMDEG